jgi:hypothetical protein
MEKAIQIFFSPLVFSIGFLMPLIAQSLLAMNLVTDQLFAYGTGLLIAVTLGLMAQVRGSWIWVKS